MKRILILLASLLMMGNAYALPECPPPDPKKVYQIARGLSLQEDWHNCIGSWKYFEFSFSGEYRDGDKYGYGILKKMKMGKYTSVCGGEAGSLMKGSKSNVQGRLQQLSQALNGAKVVSPLQDKWK